jgi:hypothetical protein
MMKPSDVNKRTRPEKETARRKKRGRSIADEAATGSGDRRRRGVSQFTAGHGRASGGYRRRWLRTG